MNPTALINNEIYNELGERWYTAEDDPVALLRAEARLRNQWVLSVLRERLGRTQPRILDIGCGAGFLSNALASHGYDVVGLDQSPGSLEVARSRDTSGRAHYVSGNALDIPYPSGHFDVVCAMDFLEHVDQPGRAIAEAARVLRLGGFFFFHTFNRNPLSRLIVIKGVEWFVRNTPPHLHTYSLFIRPDELKNLCERKGLEVESMRGSRPVFNGAFLKMLRTGTISNQFRFRWTRSLSLGYSGFAVKR